MSWSELTGRQIFVRDGERNQEPRSESGLFVAEVVELDQ